MNSERIMMVKTIEVRGKQVKFSANDKSVYLYMKKQYEYYLSFGKMYYENLEDIAESIGVSKSTLQRSLTRLYSAKVIIKSVHHGMNRISNSYVVKEI